MISAIEKYMCVFLYIYQVKNIYNEYETWSSSAKRIYSSIYESVQVDLNNIYMYIKFSIQANKTLHI